MCDKLDGRIVDANDGFLSMIVHEPIGVCGLITAWNFPLYSTVSKLGNALACGNTCVIKVSKKTPLSILKLAELVVEAGFPPGVINIITGIGCEAGEALVRHPQVDKISFSGSREVGKRVVTIAAETVKRVTLELSGQGCAIVCKDACIKKATELILQNMFHQTSNNFIALSTVFVHQSHYATFVSSAIAYCLQLSSDACDGTQDANRSKCYLGPLITEEYFLKVILDFLLA
jgi:aldehyde dehydrogenase (NAD+)